MKNQLISYIDLLFAGRPDAADIKQEILQNTLDRYDDLIASGKSPEAAYSLAISGIGDISEILGGTAPEPVRQTPQNPEKPTAKILRAIAVFLYILCPVPVLILSDEIGVCILLLLVAAATVLMILGGKSHREAEKDAEIPQTPQQKLRSSIHSIVWVVGLCLYFVISFTTGAWQITWLIFPLAAAINGLVSACMDLKEAN